MGNQNPQSREEQEQAVRERRVWEVMSIPTAYFSATLGEKAAEVVGEVWLKDMYDAGGIIIFGEREGKRPTIGAVEILKQVFRRGWGVGYFINIYALMNDARNTTYSDDDSVTVWQHCRDAQLLVVNNVGDYSTFSEKEQSMFADLLVQRQDNNRPTIIVMYGDAEDRTQMVKTFGRGVTSILAGFAKKKVE